MRVYMDVAIDALTHVPSCWGKVGFRRFRVMACELLLLFFPRIIMLLQTLECNMDITIHIALRFFHCGFVDLSWVQNGLIKNGT